MKRTPSHPPKRARAKMREDSRSKPRKMRAGRVKMTPLAMDWPAFPVDLDDVVFEDAGAAEGAEDGDGEDGDGDGGGYGEAGAEADVDGDGSEEDAEEGAEDEGAGGELGAGLGGGDEGFEGGSFRLEAAMLMGSVSVVGEAGVRLIVPKRCRGTSYGFGVCNIVLMKRARWLLLPRLFRVEKQLHAM